jgi:hypothetical protein
MASKRQRDDLPPSDHPFLAPPSASSPAKRPRPSSPSDDAAMTDAAAPPPNRPTPTSPCAPPILLVLRRVLHHVTAVGPAPPSPAPGLSPHMRSLRRHAPLREVCRAMRDAFDTHVTGWDFAGLEKLGPRAIDLAITRVLPRCTSLSALALTPPATDRSLAAQWQAYAAAAAAAGVCVRELYFAGAAELSPVPEILAATAGANLASLRVVASGEVTTRILSSVAQHCANLRALDVQLDGVDVRVLAGFGSLQCLRLLYRNGVASGDMGRLTWALSPCAASLQSVDLRIHHLRGGSDSLALLPSIPRLRKLSLFGCGPPANAWLAGCLYLHELQLEWLDGLSDAMVEELSRVIGPRLSAIRIWNCAALTDYALLALAHACPGTAVDLKFERRQFSERAIAALPSVQWEAWGQDAGAPPGGGGL